MEPIIGALLAGATAVAKETASEVIKDFYHGLKTLVKSKVGKKAGAAFILDNLDSKPDVWSEPLRDLLEASEVIDDPEIVRAAKQLLELIGSAQITVGDYNLQVAGNVGTIVQGGHISAPAVVDDEESQRIGSLPTVYPSRRVYANRRTELFKKSQNIRIHNLYPNLQSRNLDGLVIDALRDGKKVEFLVMSPVSEYIKDNELQLALIESNMGQKIESDISRLRELEYLRRTSRWSGSLEVKTYKTQPAWAVYIFDDELYAAPYLYRSEGGDTPCLHAVAQDTNQSVYGQFRRHVDRIWEVASETVNIVPSDSDRRHEGGNRGIGQPSRETTNSQ